MQLLQLLKNNIYYLIQDARSRIANKIVQLII